MIVDSNCDDITLENIIEDIEDDSVPEEKIKDTDAYASLDTVINYLEQQDKDYTKLISNLRNIN